MDVYKQSRDLRTSLCNSNAIMLSPQLFALAFVMAPPLVSAALFPSDSLVKVIDAKSFRKAMKTNVGLHSFFLDSQNDC